MFIVVWILIFMASAQGAMLPTAVIPPWTLLLSTKDSPTLPRNFRTTWDIVPACYDNTGLRDLNMSGSGQFSVSQLSVMIDYLTRFGFSPSQIVIVDLREEPHAFINGDAVRWYAQDTWWTHGYPLKMVLSDEQRRLDALSIGQVISVSHIGRKNKAGQIADLSAQSCKIRSLLTEAQIVSAAGATYVRIPVTDHTKPDDEDVDQFLDLVKKLPPRAWVHFHCHAGRGRTSTFMILYDMVRNRKLPREGIIDRQTQLAGALDIRLLSQGPKAYKNANEIKRYAFIKAFYEYLNAADGYGVSSWTKWITKRRNGIKQSWNSNAIEKCSQGG
jgi:protein-tyrosine phosphatase